MHLISFKRLATTEQGALLKGKDHYELPPCTYQFRLVTFDIKTIMHFFTKQAAFMRRSTVLSLPLQVVFPELGNLINTLRA